MTGDEFRAMRRLWDLSYRQMAKVLGVGHTTVARWERSEHSIPSSVAMQMAWLRRGYRPEEWPLLPNAGRRRTRAEGVSVNETLAQRVGRGTPFNPRGSAPKQETP